MAELNAMLAASIFKIFVMILFRRCEKQQVINQDLQEKMER